MCPSRVNRRMRSIGRTLRTNATPAERILWRALREGDLKHAHFRRQVPLGDYVADFATHSYRIVIELDGSQHSDARAERLDELRTKWLEGEGYRVVRFWNSDVRANLEGVVLKIMSLLTETPTPAPSPQGGGEAISTRRLLRLTRQRKA